MGVILFQVVEEDGDVGRCSALHVVDRLSIAKDLASVVVMIQMLDVSKRLTTDDTIAVRCKLLLGGVVNTLHWFIHRKVRFYSFVYSVKIVQELFNAIRIKLASNLYIFIAGKFTCWILSKVCVERSSL